jgi:hypothetical protein
MQLVHTVHAQLICITHNPHTGPHMHEEHATLNNFICTPVILHTGSHVHASKPTPPSLMQNNVGVLNAVFDAFTSIAGRVYGSFAEVSRSLR